MLGPWSCCDISDLLTRLQISPLPTFFGNKPSRHRWYLWIWIYGFQGFDSDFSGQNHANPATECHKNMTHLNILPIYFQQVSTFFQILKVDILNILKKWCPYPTTLKTWYIYLLLFNLGMVWMYHIHWVFGYGFLFSEIWRETLEKRSSQSFFPSGWSWDCSAQHSSAVPRAYDGKGDGF